MHLDCESQHDCQKMKMQNRSFHVQRAMHKAVYRELNQACVRYFQLTHAVEFISHLHIMQITSEEIHESSY